MSERALREIYLPGFKAAITEGGSNTIMGAYNKFRGQYCTENAYLIDTILKGEWGFKGIVISDWGAVHNTMEALENGTDLEMGTDLTIGAHYDKFFMGDTVLELVRSGKVPEALVDDKVRRILRVMFETHLMDHNRPKGSFDTKAHQEVARKVAEEGIVLLKNYGDLLPLSTGAIHSIAVIGANADRTNAQGGGSSQVRALYEVTPLAGLRHLVGDKVNITYAPGYTIARGAGPDSALINEAVKAASTSDVAIIVGGWTHGYNYAIWKDNAYDAEGYDKPDMNMPFGQDELIKAVMKANPRTVVVLLGGGPTDMTQWVDHIPAILQAWYPGMEGGNALARILFGEVNPSGKLPMSFPKKIQDLKIEYPGDGKTVHYTEGIYIGYRYYEKYGITPLFPFGHGLSYTTFQYSDLSVTPAGNGRATIHFTVKNTGFREGAEVAQVYIHEEKCSVDRPEKELKGFNKITLAPGASQVITLTLPKDAFEYYSEAAKAWVMEPGLFDILVGSSSGDIRLKATLNQP